MIMKKFQGKTREEALDLAIKELGPDVVEMNYRPVKKKGFLGFFRPQEIEVTVGLEEESVRQPERAISEAIAGVRKAAERQIRSEEEPRNVKSALETLTEASKRLNTPKSGNTGRIDIKIPETDGFQESKTMLTEGLQTPVYKKGSAAEGYTSPAKSDSSVIEEKIDSLHEMLEQQLLRADESEKEEAGESDLKETTITGNTKDGKENTSSEVEKFIKLLYNTMIENEVNEKYANQIIDEMEKMNNPNTPFEVALANTYQKMILKFGNPVGITPAEKGPKVVFFVGPTGVGKTTTIAKIASRFSVEGGRKVALLTADTYRIAAAEQLRTYANILEIPFRIIYTAEEVEQSLQDFKDYDYILVDTAGHSHQNEKQKEIMDGFIHSVDGMAEKEVFLVLSATTKYRDLISIADTYSAITDYKLIFTKLDETMTLGNLLNIKLHTGAPLSYVTAGQNVPDDIENFNPQKTVKQLLGGRK